MQVCFVGRDLGHGLGQGGVALPGHQGEAC